MLTCSKCSPWWMRHQAVVNVMHKICQFHGYTSKLLSSQQRTGTLPDKERGGPDLLVWHNGKTFAIDVSVEQLEKLDGIVKASPEEDGFLVQLDTSPQNFIKTAVYAGWELAQLQPAEHTLEQVFIRLAHNEATNEDEAAA